MHEEGDPVFLNEAGADALAMFVDVAGDVVGDADIECRSCG
jgi:hypothetical protein